MPKLFVERTQDTVGENFFTDFQELCFGLYHHHWQGNSPGNKSSVLLTMRSASKKQFQQ